jgi:hypothetical protein
LRVATFYELTGILGLALLTGVVSVIAQYPTDPVLRASDVASSTGSVD